MSEKPILFSAPMVQALLDGTKTQTRRVIKPQPGADGIADPSPPYLRQWIDANGSTYRCPYDAESLWVKETHLPKASGVIYRADFSEIDAAGTGAMYGGWKPSIFMRRIYSRITLEIVSIRAERLQDISEGDALAEGVAVGPVALWKNAVPGKRVTARDAYAELWESINGKGSWALNPWVWAISFRRVKP